MDIHEYKERHKRYTTPLCSIFIVLYALTNMTRITKRNGNRVNNQ